MKEFLVKMIPVLIFGLQTSLCFSEVRSFIGVNDAGYLIPVVVLLLLLFLLNHYLTFLKPYKKFKRFQNTKELIIDKQADEMIKSFEAKNIPLRINIMPIERKFLSAIEPGWLFGRKLCWFKRHLKPIWVSRNMDHDPDRNLCLTVTQGVAGMAIKDEKPILAFFDLQDQNLYKLNSKQIAKAEKLKVVYSFPLREIDPKTRRISNKIIGALNIDSYSDEALKLRSDDQLLRSLVRKTQALSENCSLIL